MSALGAIVMMCRMRSVAQRTQDEASLVYAHRVNLWQDGRLVTRENEGREKR